MAIPSGELNPNYFIQDMRVGLWLVAISLLLLFAKDFFYRSRKAELENQKKLFSGFAIFFTLYAIARVCFMIADYGFIHINGIPLPEFQFGRDWVGGFYFNIFWQIGTLFGVIGFTTLVFYIENYLLEKKTKLVFSVIGLALIGLVSSLGLIVRNLVYIAIAFMAAVPVILYFYYANLSEGDIKKKATICGIALSFLLGGIGLDSKLMQNILFPLNIPTKIIGTLLLILGLFIFNHEYSTTSGI